MSKALSRVDLDVIYIDEIFREKQFKEFETIRTLNWFPIAELLETYSDSPNLRLIIVKSASDFKYIPDEINDRKYQIIEQMLASFDDEATLIITNDNIIFEEDYGKINMYPINSGTDSFTTFVYENAPGVFVLDNILGKGESEDDI